MPKRPTGVFKRSDGRWYARLKFADESGKRHDIQRLADSFDDACNKRKALEHEFKTQKNRNAFAKRNQTFQALADYYEAHHLKAAEYHEPTQCKVDGLRSWRSHQSQLAALRAFFGRRALGSITYQHLRAYRAARLSEPTVRDEAHHRAALKDDPKAKMKATRSIASVNRELSLLRRMFNIARREGWIDENPFHLGESLISSADETKRERILTRDEEERFLAACTGKREHLRLIIILALDTGMRRGEILSLTWKDIDFERKRISLLARNTKTARARFVPMTARVEKELLSVYNYWAERKSLIGNDENWFESDMFGINNASPLIHPRKTKLTDVKRAFEAARKEAGLDDVQLRDLRHTAATRISRGGMSAGELGKILGHTQINTTYRYINADDETLSRAAKILDNQE